RALWNLRGEIMTPDSEAVPEVLRQSFDGVIGLSGRPSKIEQDGNDRNYRRKDCQCPDGPMGRQFLSVQQSKMLGHLFVTSHSLGHPRSGAHTGESRADKCEKDGEGLDQHERLTGSRPAEQPGPNK